MTAQNSNIVNAFETTLSAQLASGGTTMTLADDPGISAPAYFVVDPDSDSAREVIEWTAGAYNNATVSRDLDSKHGTDPTHASGTKVRLAVVKQHITDTHERIDDIAVTGAVTGTIDAATQDISTTLASGIDATKIADGTVSDAEFQYLNGVTSAIQTQLDGKQATGSYITADSADTLTNKTIDADGTGNSITNIEDANIKASAAIDATKIADGSVTSAEFQYIGGLTSDAQTQLDAKATTSNRLDEFANPTAALDINDQEVSKAVLKDYAETDVALSSTTGVVSIDLANGNTGSLTLTENITDIDFTNVPTDGVSSFTLKITQDAASAYTVATNAVTVNTSAATVKTAGGSGFTMTTTLSGIDIVTFLFFDASTDVFLNALQDFS